MKDAQNCNNIVNFDDNDTSSRTYFDGQIISCIWVVFLCKNRSRTYAYVRCFACLAAIQLNIIIKKRQLSSYTQNRWLNSSYTYMYMCFGCVLYLYVSFQTTHTYDRKQSLSFFFIIINFDVVKINKGRVRSFFYCIAIWTISIAIHTNANNFNGDKEETMCGCVLLFVT